MGQCLTAFNNLCKKSPADYACIEYKYTFVQPKDKLKQEAKQNDISKNVSCRNTGKNKSCSYAELLRGKGDAYWTDQIQEWIDDHKIIEVNPDELKQATSSSSTSSNKSENENVWVDFKRYIKTLFYKLKDENQYNDDKWKIINLKLLKLRDHERNKQTKEQISLHSPLIETPKSEEKKIEEEEETDIYINKLNEIIKSLHELLGGKNQNVLKQEAKNLECSENNDELQDIIQNCEPFKRIEVILRFYDCWMKMGKLECPTSIINKIMIQDAYEHQQLMDDFAHLKIVHIDGDNAIKKFNHQYTIGRKICMYFESYLKCKDSCNAFLRHYRNGELENVYHDDEKDVAFQHDCHKLHSYFFHSTIKFGTQPYPMSIKEEQEITKLSRITCFARSFRNESESTIKFKKKAYIGKKEDTIWWNEIDEKQSDNEIYRILVKKMGVFRAQSPHGFSTGQCRAIAHLKPKFKNIKQEVLYNEFEHLSSESWNQTLRKSTIFEHSWAGKKIRTKYKGYYDDKVTGKYEEWREGHEIDIESIVTLKLYTDFDKLQFALKRCFRHETFNDVLSNQELEGMTTHEIKKQIQKCEAIEALLKNRLESFYHWRGALLIVLNKYGTKLNSESNMVLYHGVNQKMLIKNQTFAFNGPLSTSLSYHVARTFGTAKGMVLKITSYFPRLNYCNAFDASLLSDYPEEQEWLIGFMYVRLLEVRTRKLTDKFKTYKDLVDKIPLASWTREAFFCLHLFKEQIFSMSEHLERLLAQFLKVNRLECCKQSKKYEQQNNQFKDWDMNINFVVNKICSKYHLQRQRSAFFEATEESDNTKEDAGKSNRIFAVIWNKFNECRQQPNRKQRIKFDMISNNLKRFFMQETKEINVKTKENKWRISWQEIIIVYPNIQEIHFINQYKLTDIVLHNLIKCINRKDNKVQKVLFLYYNYKNTNKNDKTNKPSNQKIFQDPDTLDDGIKSDFENLGWIIKHGATGKHGYKIRLYDSKNTN